MNCIFCRIIAKEVPNHTIYEDENILAFLDIFPCAPGHTVVILKRHAERLTDLEPAERALLMGGVDAAMRRIDKVLQPVGTNVGFNDRAPAGQAVPHLHVHLIPRYEGDGGGSMHSIVKYNDGRAVGDIAALFSNT